MIRKHSSQIQLLCAVYELRLSGEVSTLGLLVKLEKHPTLDLGAIWFQATFDGGDNPKPVSLRFLHGGCMLYSQSGEREGEMIKFSWNHDGNTKDVWITTDDISYIYQSGDRKWTTIKLRSGSELLVQGEAHEVAKEIEKHHKKHH